MLIYYHILILILSLYYYINDIYFVLRVTLIFPYYTIIFIKIGRKCAIFIHTCTNSKTTTIPMRCRSVNQNLLEYRVTKCPFGLAL